MGLFLTSLFATSSHRLVFTSICSILIVILTIFTYTNVYPKKRLSYLLILMLLSIPPIVSIFRPGTYESGDINIHITRLMSFYKALKEGVFIPIWGGELNSTYGYAIFEFIYPLPYYAASLFHLIGFSFLGSIKLLLISSFIGSGVAMFYWLKNHMSEKSAMLGSIFYLYAPYHLVDMHFRSNIGEMLTFVFLPLTLYLIDKQINKKGFRQIFITALSYAFLVLSHPGLAILGSGLIFVYILYIQRTKNPKVILKSVAPLLLGLLFSAFYWIPANLESKYILADVKYSSLQFLSISELIYSKWRYGLLFQGPKGELSFLIGYGHWLAVLFAIYLIIYKKSRNLFLLFFVMLLSIYIFLLLKNSKLIWESFSILRSMRLTYRALTIVALLTSTIAGLTTEKFKNKIVFIILIVIAISTSILNWGNRRNLPDVKDSQLALQLPYSSERDGCYALLLKEEETDDRCQYIVPASHIEAINGKLNVLEEYRITNIHSYKVDVNNKTLIKENTSYFPGWKVYDNGVETPIKYDNKDYPGIITFNLDPGIHNLKLTFVDSNIRKYSLLLSELAFCISLFIIVLPNKKHLKYWVNK